MHARVTFRGLQRCLLLLSCAAAVELKAQDTREEERQKVYTWAGRPLPANQMGISIKGTKLDTPPRLLRGEAPTYPIMQRRYGGGGFAVIGFVIDESGRTRDFTVVNTNYKYFAGAAIIAMKGWRFEPARLNGKPVAVHARVPFTFTTDRRLLRRKTRDL